MESCDILVFCHLGVHARLLGVFLQDLVHQLQAEAEPPLGLLVSPQTETSTQELLSKQQLWAGLPTAS